MCFPRPERECDVLPEQAQLAGVGRDDTGQDLDQRALTRTVLTEQPVDFAGSDLQLGAVEGQRAAVPLGDAASVEQRRAQTGTAVCQPGDGRPQSLKNPVM
jgi:hypothetical protein